MQEASDEEEHEGGELVIIGLRVLKGGHGEQDTVVSLEADLTISVHGPDFDCEESMMGDEGLEERVWAIGKDGIGGPDGGGELDAGREESMGVSDEAFLVEGDGAGKSGAMDSCVALIKVVEERTTAFSWVVDGLFMVIELDIGDVGGDAGAAKGAGAADS